MKTKIHPTRFWGSRSGMTLPEVMATSSISVVVVAAVMVLYIWSARQSSEAIRKTWSQKEAMMTSERLTMLIRNARRISAIDEAKGDWVDVEFPDDSVLRIIYTYETETLREGRMYIVSSNDTHKLVARGMTALQTPDGFSMPVFTKTPSGALRVGMRVSEPEESQNPANDNVYASSMRFAVHPRNAEE